MQVVVCVVEQSVVEDNVKQRAIVLEHPYMVVR